MKKGFVLFAVALSLPGVACAGEVVVSNGVLWAESPLDFEIGSTEYAQMLGERLRSRAYATFDPQTKVTTTNVTWATNARLAKPFYGNREVYLGFTGADRRLDTLHLFNLKIAVEVNGASARQPKLAG